MFSAVVLFAFWVMICKKRNMTEMVIVPEVSQGDDIFSSDFWIVNVVICRSIKASSYPEPWPGPQKHLAQAQIHSHMITSHWLVCSSYLVKYHSQLFSCDSNSAAAALVYSSSILSARANWWINHQSSCDKNWVLSFNTGSRHNKALNVKLSGRIIKTQPRRIIQVKLCFIQSIKG